LRQKSLVKGLTNEEIIEYNDLNFVEVINTGYALNSKTEDTYKGIEDKQRKIKKNKTPYLPRRIQTRSITQMYKQDIEKVKEESLKETY
jgi:spermidine/putrescine-binding protein